MDRCRPGAWPLYEGRHAFVFPGSDDDISSIIADLDRTGDIDPDSGPVYFISPFEGAFESFAHIAQDNVPELADYIHGRLWDAGIATASTWWREAGI